MVRWFLHVASAQRGLASPSHWVALGVIVLSLVVPALVRAQTAGWVELAEQTVIRSAERTHRIRVRDTTPVDLLYISARATGVLVESVSVTRADGSRATMEVGAHTGVGGGGVYVPLCGSAAPVTRIIIRHPPLDPRFNLRVGVWGAPRSALPTAPLALPCADATSPPADAEAQPGLPWGATHGEVRAHCAAAGGTLAESDSSHFACVPYGAADGASADFYFTRARGSTSWALQMLQLTRRPAPEDALRELRDVVAPWLARFGRPRFSDPRVGCDPLFFSSAVPCGTRRREYGWGPPLEPTVSVILDTSNPATPFIRTRFERWE